MAATGFFVRDTLVNYDVLNSLPVEKKARIIELTQQYSRLGYIDARTQIGPDQYRRMSQKQHEQISNKAVQVFAIESEIKQLLKSNEQLQAEQVKEDAKAKQDRINRIQWRIRDIEMYLQRKLTSNRENPTKKEYRELKEHLILLHL